MLLVADWQADNTHTQTGHVGNLLAQRMTGRYAGPTRPVRTFVARPPAMTAQISV